MQYWFYLFIVGAFLAFVIPSAWRDYSFYYKNGWDFSQDSGVVLTDESDEKSSPRKRLLFGHPSFVVMPAIGFVWLLVQIMSGGSS